MGYRSNVGIALTKHGVERLNKALKTANDNTRKAVNDFLDSPDEYARDVSGAEVYFWTFYKWYENEPQDYPEVAFFQKLFKELDCGDYLFLRIGQSLDDAESDGTFFDNPFGMRMIRDIEIAGKQAGRMA